MGITITDLDVTENYADNTRLTQAQLNAAMTSIETGVNTRGYRNIEQLAEDIFGENSGYPLDNDGAPNRTNTVYNKQSGTDTYNAGNIAIGIVADAAYAAVDAVNAAIAFTPEATGKYLAMCYFTHRATSNATSEWTVDVNFRLTDATTASMAVNSGIRMPATAAGAGEFYHPVYIIWEFDWSTTAARTITLQKFVRTATNVATNVVAAAAASGEVFLEVHKI